MGDSSGSSRGMFDIDNLGVLEFTGKIMVLAVIFLAFLVVFVSCLRIYSKWFWSRRHENVTTATTRRRLDFAAAQQEMRIGLDPAVLDSIPVIVVDPKEVKDGLECAVCLCELSEGEKARLLPKCNHGFHVECIDMWFQSHSTCPLCRNPIADQNQPNPAAESTLETILQAPIGEEGSGVGAFPTESPNFPTNVLIWGNETQVSTLGPSVEENSQGGAVAEPSGSSPPSSSMGSTSNRPDGILVIDIPRPINEEDEQKSPAPTRLRSLKRLLSGHRRTNPSSPRTLDIEQGGGA